MPSPSQPVVEYDIYDPFQYPWMCINMFLAFWFSSNAVRWALIQGPHTKDEFQELTEDKKRNVITYIFQFFITLLAFILQLYGGADVLFQLSDITTTVRLNSVVLGIVLLAILYTWELCFRENIGWPLLIHHVITLLLAQCLTASFFETHNILYIRYAILLGFHATTEQISFVALVCFRLKLCSSKYQSLLFAAAALQSFVLKTLVTLAALVLFIREAYIDGKLNTATSRWDSFWKVAFIPLLCMLYGSQLYACKILYILAERCKAKRIEEEGAGGMDDTGDTAGRGAEMILEDFESMLNSFRRATTPLRRFSPSEVCKTNEDGGTRRDLQEGSDTTMMSSIDEDTVESTVETGMFGSAHCLVATEDHTSPIELP
jgi:hypothetical protein